MRLCSLRMKWHSSSKWNAKHDCKGNLIKNIVHSFNIWINLYLSSNHLGKFGWIIFWATYAAKRCISYLCTVLFLLFCFWYTWIILRLCGYRWRSFIVYYLTLFNLYAVFFFTLTKFWSLVSANNLFHEKKNILNCKLKLR